MSEILYDFSKRQDETVFDQLVRVSVDKINKLHKRDWTDIREDFNFEHSSDNLRKYATGFKLMVDNGYVKGNVADELPKYKEVTELKGDGTQTSDKLIRISEQDMKNPDSVLIAHGYNPKEFELVNSRSSMWNSSVDNTLYSSRITVKPKIHELDIEGLVKATKEAIKHSTLEYIKTETSGLLTIPFVDLHFGINTYESYLEKLNDTVEVIRSKKWNVIYIPFGHDLLHNNDHKGKTANGTTIEKVDMTKAWKDALKFYKIIFDEAIQNSSNVVSDYVCGNHDADITWAFAQTLEELYPQVKWDTSIKNKKYFKWEKILLVSLHGEKGLPRVPKTLFTKYRDLVVGSKLVEIYSGHFHAERVRDEQGILVRTLPTSAEEDDWHVENSFEGSVKISQIFEYRTDRLKTIHQV